MSPNGSLAPQQGTVGELGGTGTRKAKCGLKNKARIPYNVMLAWSKDDRIRLTQIVMQEGSVCTALHQAPFCFGNSFCGVKTKPCLKQKKNVINGRKTGEDVYMDWGSERRAREAGYINRLGC